MKRAVFLDRDGTINEDAGDLYSEDKLIFIPGAIEALKILQKMFLLFSVTNQSGIGGNIFSDVDLPFTEDDCLSSFGYDCDEDWAGG